ncbi:MAG: RNA polymerase subunit sigma-24, partial [Burkholderiaceae bacterium]
EHRTLLAKFALAATKGDLPSLRALVAPEATLIGDGGGVVPSFGKVLRGGLRVAMLYFATARRYSGTIDMRVIDINGEPGIVRFIGGVLESVMNVQLDDAGRIRSLHVQRNPAKLVRVLEQLGG